MFDIKKYFNIISQKIQLDSDLIAKSFSSHHPSSGQNKEKLVLELLNKCLPSRYIVDTGLVVDSEGNHSHESDLLIADGLNDFPFFSKTSKSIWFAESIYAAIEIKSKLGPIELDDSLEKCKCFKNLKRKFDESTQPRITDSLFIIWAFDCDSNESVKSNLINKISNIPVNERPDMVIVPNRFFIKMGQYRDLTEYGQVGSNEYKTNGYLKKQMDLNNRQFMTCWDLGENAVMTFILYLTNWLKMAGSRSANLFDYLKPDEVFGKEF